MESGLEPSRPRTARRRALFVDRDGTLNPDFRYLAEAERLELFRGVGQALWLARAHGYLIICVTNQSGVSRGLYSSEVVEEIHRRLNDLLAPEHAAVDAFYYCPHAPEDRCGCRKPGTDLFQRARSDWQIDFATSAIIGDRALDVQAGDRLGLLTAVVPPPGAIEVVEAELRAEGVRPEIRASSFFGAVARILARG